MFTKKNMIRAAFVTIVIIGAVFSGAAQEESTFEDNTLYKLQDKAKILQDNRVLRLTILEESFENGGKIPVHSEKYINEIIPPDRNHFISEKKSKTGVERTEYIDIGQDRYIKKNNGNWEIFKPEEMSMGVGSGNGSGGETVKIETSSANKLTRGVIINNQKTDYYEITITYKYLYPTGTIVDYTKKGFWFDAQGRYVKTLEEGFNAKTKNMSRNTTEYEYDPNIKIEAPIKN